MLNMLSSRYDPPIACTIVEDGRQSSVLTLPVWTTSPSSGEQFAQEQEDAEWLFEKGGYLTEDGFTIRLCSTCPSRCVPARIPLADFKINKRHNKVLKANIATIFSFKTGGPDFRSQSVLTPNPYIVLYRNYMRIRFNRTSKNGFGAWNSLEKIENVKGLTTYHLDMRNANELLEGCSIIHVASRNAFGTRYFFDNALRNEKSPGHFMTLKIIEQLQAMDLQYLYIGGVNPNDCDFSWKLKYTPIELRINGVWQRFSRADLHNFRAPGAHGFPKKRFG